ncbi:cyclophane-forming radical SAM/SPASM peptide maturase YhhB [Moraxella oblonga]|uniref:cyclophane-forming radical SAM/SPASM peptide maturase YhhB n=1 Tax=Moraxella oblonga TaxID=200413 RepID=UPI00082B3B7B|nr:cyclophane-forming radical SAM/SPASM peptide maturase YhhB [Moraxella oblonga]
MVDTVLIKTASRCNINCTYCYVYNLGDDGWKENPKLMSIDTIDNIINTLRNIYQYQGHSFAIVLHGGEPLLLPKDRLEHLLKEIRRNLPDYTTISIQTNGLLITNEIIELCHKYKTTLAISLDGDKIVNDANRIDHKGKGTYDRIIEKINLVQNHPKSKSVFTGLLAVINPFSNPKKVYKFFKELNVPSVNFLMRDGNHDHYPFGKSNYNSLEYGKWLSDMWLQYFNDANPIPIAVFDNIVKTIMGGESQKEGTGLDISEILIIDTSGEITKNDTLKSTKNKADKFDICWNVNDENFDVIQLLHSTEYKDYIKMQNPTSQTCLECNILHICGGGMPLYRWSEHNGFDNPSVFCNDHKYLINSIFETVNDYVENTK